MPKQAPANALRLPVAMNRNRHFRGLTSRIRDESRYTDERPILSESQDRLSLLIGPQNGGDLIVSHMLDGRKEAKTQNPTRHLPKKGMKRGLLGRDRTSNA